MDLSEAQWQVLRRLAGGMCIESWLASGERVWWLMQRLEESDAQALSRAKYIARTDWYDDFATYEITPAGRVADAARDASGEGPAGAEPCAAQTLVVARFMECALQVAGVAYCAWGYVEEEGKRYSVVTVYGDNFSPQAYEALTEAKWRLLDCPGTPFFDIRVFDRFGEEERNE
jgi:hypothetical protein